MDLHSLMGCTVFNQILERRAATTPQQTAYVYLEHGEQPGPTRTYAQLHQRATALAGHLATQLSAGDRALLLFEPGLDFIDAFMACCYAGVVAVPLPPYRTKGRLAHVAAIAADAEPAALLTTAALRDKTPAWKGLAPRLIAVDETVSGAPPPVFTPTPATLAFLQYTSGSTGTPKGVMVSHHNLMTNARDLANGTTDFRDRVMVSWLPTYHDMGLIYGVLQPLFAGYPAYLAAPASFLQEPIRWLRAMSRFRATNSAAPNFAYNLCIDKFNAAQCDDLDLSSWRSACNGAEPIRAETLQRFSEVFGRYGFRPEAFCTGYGLAEATLKVASIGEDTYPPLFDDGTQQHVGCGRSRIDTLVRIVDPETARPLADGERGEIWIKGATVAQGYWNRPALSQTTFHATTADGDGPYLRSGDLGFVHEGSLYVVDRLKDLIIHHGRNIAPRDLETTAWQSHAALCADGCAAFATAGATMEHTVLVAEVARTATRNLAGAEMAAAIRAAVWREHGVPLHTVVLIRQASLPKTSSGKVQRSACRKQFLAGDLRELMRDSIQSGDKPADRELLLTQLTAWLLADAQTRAQTPAFAEQSLSRLGLDSLAVMALQNQLEQRTGRTWPTAIFWENNDLTVLAERLAATAPAALQPCRPLPCRDFGDAVPLSHNQRALWFTHKLRPDDSAYTLVLAARFEDGLDITAFKRATDALQRAYPILSGHFCEENGIPRANCGEHRDPFLRVVDVSGQSIQAVQQRRDRECGRPFDLENGPLFKVWLFTRADGPTELLVTASHLIGDYRSFDLLLQRWGAFYRDITTAPTIAPNPKPQLPGVFADREAMQQSQASAAYWRRELDGLVPFDGPDGDWIGDPQAERVNARHAFAVDAATTALLTKASQNAQSSLAAWLTAAFAAVLARAADRDEVALLVPVDAAGAGPDAEEVGYLVNMLVLRAAGGGNPTFAAFAAQVDTRLRGALSHRDTPFAQLCETAATQAAAGRNPFSSVCFAFAGGSGRVLPGGVALGVADLPFQIGPLRLRTLAHTPAHAQFALTLQAAQADDQLLFCFDYDASRYEPAGIQRLATRLTDLLTAVAADPSQRLRHLTRTSEVERRLQLEAWNRTAAPLPAQPLLHELFDAQVRATPHAVALLADAEKVSGQRKVSYSSLAEKVENLRRRLYQHGVRAESRVGLHLSRGIGLVTSMLAVLKAGGAYVPLEPGLPPGRLQAMARDAALTTIITDVADATRHFGETMLYLKLNMATGDFCDANGDAAPTVSAAQNASLVRRAEHNEQGQPPNAPRPQLQGDNAVYLMYTSGSTGRPKGVVNTHAALTNRLLWMKHTYPLGVGDAVLQKTTAGFDVSVWEFFLPLISGATLVFPIKGGETDPTYLAKVIPSHKITTIHFVPAMLSMFLDDAAAAGATSLRRIICSGEALPPALLQRCRARLPRVAVHNLYGPTEAAIDVSFHACNDEPARRSVPIGRPIDNTQLYVLDDNMAPLPIGCAGELYIGGIALARGYFGRGDLTAAAFVPNPFGDGTRLYRSGDRARFLADGTIEYLGRVDRQLKLRGVRIEPGEIEAVLLNAPGITRAAVVCREGAHGEAQLDAFLCEDGSLKRDTREAEIRRHAGDMLTTAMVPTHFTFLDAMPLTASGKVDRKALKAMPECERRHSFRALHEAELPIGEIWRELLGVERIGRYDHFFELGGHSLMLVKLRRRLTELYQVDISLDDLLQNATPARQAGHLARLRAAAGFVSNLPQSTPSANTAGAAAFPAPSEPLGDDEEEGEL